MTVKLSFNESVLESGEGPATLEVSGETVGQCLDYAFERQPQLKKAVLGEKGNFISGVFIRVNGEFIYSDPVAKPVKDGDEIEIVYFAGG